MDMRDLVPWNWGGRSPARRDEPHDPFRALQEGMNRLFDDFARRFDAGWPSEWRPFSVSFGEGGFVPRVNVTEDDQNIEVSAELPGLDEKDIDVSLTRDSLTIQGEKKSEQEQNGKGGYRIERAYGAFRRTIPLPWEVQADQVRAHFKKGVLTILLPKSPEARKDTRRIAVRAE
jgi:HSP20 family protein